MPAQYVDLVRDFVGSAEQIAGVGVLRDEPQRLALTRTNDEDPRSWLADGQRAAQGFRQLVVSALVSAGVARPHLQADLECFFEPLESFCGRREGHTETLVF